MASTVLFSNRADDQTQQLHGSTNISFLKYFFLDCFFPIFPYCVLLLILILYCTATYCHILQLEMHVHLICAIKFYLLTYLIIYLCCNTPPCNTHTHTRLTALCPGLPGRASTRKVKSIWILLKQERVSGSSISWAICKSAPRCRQTTKPVPHCAVLYRPDALHAA